MAEGQQTAPLRKTSRAHKPTRKAQESAEQAKKANPPPSAATTKETTAKSPDDMTLDELVEHIDAPMREYLAEAAQNADQPSPTAWDHHKRLMESAEEEERSECDSDPVVTLETGEGQKGDDESSEEGGYSPDLLTPQTNSPAQPPQELWAAIKQLIEQSNLQSKRMEAMEQRSIARSEQMEQRLIETVQASKDATDGRFHDVQNEIRALKGELHLDIKERMEAASTKLEGMIANSQADLMIATEEIKKKMAEIHQVHDKAKGIANLAHEARNKYQMAAQQSDQRINDIETTINTYQSQIKLWETQMGRHDELMAQVGNVKALMQSVEARQRDMDQAKKEITQLQQNIAQSASKWENTSKSATQMQEFNKQQQSLIKTTTKLENDVVQAHAYWKKQWGELKNRIQKCERQGVDDLYIKQIMVATLQQEDWHRGEKCHMEEKESVQRQMDDMLRTFEQRANDMQGTMDKQVEGYIKEVKEYVEKAAEVYQNDLLRCSEQQQAKLTQLIQDWEAKHTTQQQEQASSIKTPPHNKVPEQVDITTNDSIMGMSRRSIDPPEVMPTRRQQQQIQSGSDVRVQDRNRQVNEQQHQPGHTREAAHSHHRWTDVDAPRERRTYEDNYVTNEDFTPPKRQNTVQHRQGIQRHPGEGPRNPYNRTRPVGQHALYGERGLNLRDTFDQEFEEAFTKDEKYLMGLDGVEELTIMDLEHIGFVDPSKAYRAFHLEHQNLMANWHMTTSRGKIVGPNQKQLLQDINLFNPLASTRQADVIDFIAQFHDLMDSYNIAVMPFSMIEVQFGVVGLCLPGVGELKYDRMGQALSKILYGHLIPHNIDRCGKLDQLLLNVKNAIPPNGYKMLHILLEQYVDPFKPHMVDIKWPTFSGCKNIFDYAGQFSVIMQLYEKKGERIEPRKAAIKFLEAVKKEGGVTYKAAALLLKTAIMERPPTAELPARFTIGNMATFIADSNANTSDDDEESQPKTSSRIFKTQLPTRTIMQEQEPHQWINESTKLPAIPTAVEHSSHTVPTQKASVSTLTSDLNRYMQGYTPHRHRINQTYCTKPNDKEIRPTPEPQRSRNNSRRRRAYDPYTKCHACGRTGHTAVQCDTLAMAILIRKYMQESGNATAMQQASENWFKRNEEALQCPQSEVASKAQPLQVLHTYMDRYLKDLDELDDQMDWDFFRNDDNGVQEGQE